MTSQGSISFSFLRNLQNLKIRPQGLQLRPWDLKFDTCLTCSYGRTKRCLNMPFTQFVGHLLRYHGRWIENRALRLTLWKKTPLTYTFSESLIVIKYNYIFEIFKKKSMLKWYLKKSPKTLLRLNWFASARELSERHDKHRKCFHTHRPLKGCLRFSIGGLVFVLQPPKVWYSQCGRSSL